MVRAKRLRILQKNITSQYEVLYSAKPSQRNFPGWLSVWWDDSLHTIVVDNDLWNKLKRSSLPPPTLTSWPLGTDTTINRFSLGSKQRRSKNAKSKLRVLQIWHTWTRSVGKDKVWLDQTCLIHSYTQIFPYTACFLFCYLKYHLLTFHRRGCNFQWKNAKLKRYLSPGFARCQGFVLLLLCHLTNIILQQQWGKINQW